MQSGGLPLQVFYAFDPRRSAILLINQPAVAKLEKRGDMHVSNFRRYIEALGGTLEITAHFGKAAVVISNVGETPK